MEYVNMCFFGGGMLFADKDGNIHKIDMRSQEQKDLDEAVDEVNKIAPTGFLSHFAVEAI